MSSIGHITSLGNGEFQIDGQSGTVSFGDLSFMVMSESLNTTDAVFAEKYQQIKQRNEKIAEVNQYVSFLRTLYDKGSEAMAEYNDGRTESDKKTENDFDFSLDSSDANVVYTVLGPSSSGSDNTLLQRMVIDPDTGELSSETLEVSNDEVDDYVSGSKNSSSTEEKYNQYIKDLVDKGVLSTDSELSVSDGKVVLANVNTCMQNTQNALTTLNSSNELDMMNINRISSKRSSVVQMMMTQLSYLKEARSASVSR